MAKIDLTVPEHAYFFGFLQTDGHHSGDSRPGGQRGRISVEISAIDAPLLHRFQVLVQPLNSSISFRTRVTNFGPNVSATWTACDLGLRRELLSLGLPIGMKSEIVAPPRVTFSAPDYLRGLVDGNGSVGFTAKGMPFVSFVTPSTALAEYFCEQVRAVTGAIRTPSRNTRDNIFNPMIASDPAATFAGWLYPPGCLALERKRNAAAKVAAWVRPSHMRPRAPRRSWTADEDAYVLAMPVQQAAKLLGRTEKSVGVRSWRLRNGIVQGHIAS